ncbi:hypothetical protein [Streptomyces sp. YKOK-I1]
MGWKQQRAEIKRLMDLRPDPDGRHGDESQEARAINDELNRRLEEQPVWRRGRIFYGG